MTAFYALTAGIAAVLLSAMALAVVRTRDTLHPTVVLAPMLGFLYVGMPLYLAATDGFQGFLTEDHLQYAQGLNLWGVVAAMAGALLGGRGARFDPRRRLPEPPAGPRVALAAKALGAAGLAGFAVGLAAVGGLTAAYSSSYGGGSSESGYVRELYHLTAPALLMLVASGALRRSRVAWAWLAALALPLALHGLLGARRGPLFVVIVTLAAAHYLLRNARPRLWQVLGGGAALGLALLFVVANRDQIYIGSELDLRARPTDYIEAGAGNEFIYGAGAMIAASEADLFSWGGRYATVLFVRPIPRALWPTKYEDAAELFGTNIETNMGIDVHALRGVLGWTGAYGAAPGIVADMWIELGWGYLLALFGIFYAHGAAWRRAVTRGGLAAVAYGTLLCLSVYLTMQTLEAMLFRFLIMAVPAWAAWRLASRGARRRAATEPA